MTKLEMKVTRLEKELLYLQRAVVSKKKELGNARAALRQDPHADKRKFK